MSSLYQPPNLFNLTISELLLFCRAWESGIIFFDLRTTLSTLLLFCLCASAVAQNTQLVTGRVVDKDTRQPLIGATIQVLELGELMGATTNAEGNYSLPKVPVGRRKFQVTYVGYKAQVLEGIVNSVKTLVLDVELTEDIMTGDEVVITAYANNNAPVNDLAVVSARSFSAEETERYAASVNDPGRMALSFPGVNQGKDDSENDIIIRGNSSRGMLWRLEGIDIPNPNHFARPGTSGGGVTVFSAQLLSRSDFSSGAMAAEYGNVLSGAFDISFRPGNLNEREYRAKAGLLGLDFMAEGPIKEGKSSYLVNYRYSTLGILTNMGVYLVGERVTNQFQDLSFNTMFLMPNGKDAITVFGLGGLSREHYQPVTNPEERVPGMGSHWEDRVRTHNMGAMGLTYTKTLDESSFLKTVVAIMGNYQHFVNDTLNLADVRYNYGVEEYSDWRIGTSLTYNKKFDQATKLKAGLQAYQIYYDFYQQENPRSSSTTIDPNQVFGVSLDGNDNTQTIQQYAQINQKLGARWTANAGYHVLGLLLNNSWAIDPRASVTWQATTTSRVSLAGGQYSQIVPLGAYFHRDSLGRTTNDDLGLMNAYHLIGGYRLSLSNGLSLTLEGYLQFLRNIPVKADGDEEYWFLNSQSGFPTFALSQNGGGRNRGLDLSVEKYFSNGFFMLLTGSMFKSTFTANGGPMYPSNFDTKFSSSYTLAREWQVKESNTFQIGTRVLYNGGFRYTPYDVTASAAANRYVPQDGRINASQVTPYFRIDGRLQYRMNRKRIASVLSLDIQNVMNRANQNSISYNAVTNMLDFTTYTSGLVPVLSYQIDF